MVYTEYAKAFNKCELGVLLHKLKHLEYGAKWLLAGGIPKLICWKAGCWSEWKVVFPMSGYIWSSLRYSPWANPDPHPHCRHGEKYVYCYHHIKLC